MNNKSIDENHKRCSNKMKSQNKKKQRQMQQIENSKTVDSDTAVSDHFKCEESESSLLRDLQHYLNPYL